MRLRFGWSRRLMLLAFGLAVASGGRVALAAPDPAAARAMIDTVGADVLAVLGSQDLDKASQVAKLKELLDRAIDLDATGRLILGQNWRRVTEAQQQDYLKLFRPYALDNLASRILASNAKVPLDRFEIVGTKMVSDRDLVVSTDLFWPGYPTYRLDWRLREIASGALKAIDVVVEGVSLVVSQRSEFAAIIGRQGMDGLLDQMRQHVDRQA